MSASRYTIVLPASVGRRVHSAARAQKRDPADVAVEAIRLYFSRRGFLTEAATADELRAIRRGENAYRKGDYVTLDEYLNPVGSASRRPRKKVARSHRGA
jgi:predicted transcriptional regulator